MKHHSIQRGVDTTIYHAAGEEELLAERKKIGWMKEGDVAITSGFKLPAKFIIHAVSPWYIDGKLSPCDKRDIIFSFFIENEIYDMIEIDIALEKYDVPCFVG